MTTGVEDPDTEVERPHVATHALLSVDGRLEGFPPDLARYYQVAGRIAHQAVLVGSGTLVAAAADAGIDLDAGVGHASGAVMDAGAPLLVVVDSRGRVGRYDWLQATGLWGDVVVLGSRRTPAEHRARLEAAGIPLEAIGEDRVDLRGALELLRTQRGVAAVRVDAGPGLNAALLRAGLLDEVSVLLAPYLVGAGRGWLDGLADGAARPLQLISTETLPDGHVWLRYLVARSGA